MSARKRSTKERQVARFFVSDEISRGLRAIACLRGKRVHELVSEIVTKWVAKELEERKVKSQERPGEQPQKS